MKSEGCCDRDGDHRDDRGQCEAAPCHESAQPAGPEQSNRESHLAACRAGQDLTQSDELSELRIIQPLPTRDEFMAKIADMSGRTAERRQAKFQEGEKDRSRSARVKGFRLRS